MKNITIWNITFDVDGELYVLDELSKGNRVENMLMFLLDNVTMDDI